MNFLGFSLATAKRRLQQLKDDGIIIRVGSDKSGYWEVVKKIDQFFFCHEFLQQKCMICANGLFCAVF